MPPALSFQTKSEVTLSLLDQARTWEVPHQWMVADADDGDHPHFLPGLEARRKFCVVGVRMDFRVSLQRKATSPMQWVDRRQQALPRWRCCTIRWRHGARGQLRKKFVAVRCGRVTADGPRHVGWVLGEQATSGQLEEREYDWTDLPAAATLEELAGYAHCWYAVEPFHKEANGEGRWDQYQSWLWPGFHRQGVTVMLTCSLLVWLELRQRYRRPCRGHSHAPASPSAGPPSAGAPSGPSRGPSLTAPPSGVVVDHLRSVHRTLLTKSLTKQS